LMSRMTGAQLIVQLLERQGVRVIAGIPGGANLPIYDALFDSEQIRHVLVRHEQGAGFIAHGIARATGETSVCLVTSGPGATNVLTALADAKADSVPMVCISGQVPTRMIGTDAFQEVDTYGMSLPVTKHNFLVRSVEELLHVIPHAFRIAASGRPGPVLVDVPKDVQCQSISVEQWPTPGRAAPLPTCSDDEVDRAAAMINASRRPILYVGGGVIQSGASALLTHAAEKAGIPVTMTLMGLGVINADHPLSLGMLGMHAARYTNLALDECDLLIAAGVRFDDRATGKVAEFCPQAKVIHIDIDPSELDKIRTAHIGIQGDLGEVLKQLLPRIHVNLRRSWSSRIQQLKQEFPLAMPGGDDPTTPYGLLLESARLLGDDAIVTSDVGQHQMWTAQAYPFRRPRQWLTSGGLGTMGFGLPAAIGAALAEPDRTVVCFTGDGSLLMNIQELVTAAELNVNVKVVVLDNNSLGLVHQQQQLFYNARLYASDFSRAVDFVKIADGFGVAAFDLGETSCAASTLAEAFSTTGPCLVRVPIHADEKVYPMVPPGAANRDMIGGLENASV
jgi:acetolactate synthase-1/2/3 large subunit